ncbi:hypothetical protein [Streptomyces sp. NPDC098781]|uniref:hypothetical protein n=1 Tax=Streptomyces sp. NPDC098781 TaxID=3366097 RepID=UPI00380D34A2
MTNGGLRTLGPAVLLGKVMAWTTCLLATVLLGCWLFLVKSGLRDAVVLGCAIGIAVLTVSAWALRRSSGNPDAPSVYRALADRASIAGGREPGVLPARLRGASAQLNGQVLTFYGAVMALILPLALGVGDPTPTGRAAEIASSGAVVRQLPVESVRDVVRDRHNNGSTYYCTVSVTLPSVDPAGSGRRVEFRSEWSERAEVGGKVYVAYAPDRPELGAVGDDDRAGVDRALSGRAMSNWWTWILGLGWLGLVGTLFVGSFTSIRDQRFPRRLRGDERVLRAVVSGYDGHGAGKTRIGLSTPTGPVQLHVDGKNARYVDTVGQAEGHLVWAPDRNKHGGKQGPHRTGAVFVGDAGWFIPGGLAPDYEESARAKADQHASVAPAGENRLLDLDCGWILSIPNRLMNALLISALCVLALALPVSSGVWRPVVGITCAVGLLAYGMAVAVSKDTPEREQSNSTSGAAGTS